MFKNIFKAKLKDKTDHEKPLQMGRERSNQPSSPHVLEEIHDKPFDIDLDDLNNYEERELQVFIKKYEQFTSWMRSRYNDMLSEYVMAKEKLILMEDERKRLVNQNGQYAAEIDNLKKSLDERKMLAMSMTELQSTKSSSPQRDENEEAAIDLAGLEDEEDTTVAELKLKAEKLISELNSVKQILNKDIKSPVKEQHNEQVQIVDETEGDEQEDKEDKEGNEDKEGAGQEGLENEEEGRQGDQPNEDSSLPETIETKETKEVAQIESQDLVYKIIEDAEAELKNIISSCMEMHEKARLREREMVERMKKEIAQKARNEEYERHVQELKGMLSQVQTKLDEEKAKLEAQENLIKNTEKKLEENSVSYQEEKSKFQESITAGERRIKELEGDIERLKEEMEKSEHLQKEAERDNSETQRRMKALQEECDAKIAAKEKIEIEVNKELYACKKTLQDTEEERKKFEKRFHSSETKKNDIENSLIQERLKHHQTTCDLDRAKEKLVEMEKSLNEEVEARKGDIRKNEDLRRHLVEMERKLKEHRRVINKLSEQVMDLENGGPKDNHERSEKEASPSHGTMSEPGSIERGGEINDLGAQDYMEKALLVNAQASKIQQLEGRLDEVLKEMKVLIDSNEQLKEDKAGLGHQVKVLQEKRETGLQEIKRLSLLLEKSRGNRPLPEALTPVERKNGKSNESMKLVRMGSLNLNQSSGRNVTNQQYETLRKIKQRLEEVYKEIIMTITNEKLHENSEGRKAVGKLGQLVKGPLPSENFMKIEKKMNDTVVDFQEFMENFE